MLQKDFWTCASRIVAYYMKILTFRFEVYCKHEIYYLYIFFIYRVWHLHLPKKKLTINLMMKIDSFKFEHIHWDESNKFSHVLTVQILRKQSEYFSTCIEFSSLYVALYSERKTEENIDHKLDFYDSVPVADPLISFWTDWNKSRLASPSWSYGPFLGKQEHCSTWFSTGSNLASC